jgi:hypothetical protein
MKVEGSGCRTITLDMLKAAVGALIEHKVIAGHAGGDDYLRTWNGVEAALRHALNVAPWCEHGIMDGEYCQPCNAEYKRAAREAYGDSPA